MQKRLAYVTRKNIAFHPSNFYTILPFLLQWENAFDIALHSCKVLGTNIETIIKIIEINLDDLTWRVELVNKDFTVSAIYGENRNNLWVEYEIIEEKVLMQELLESNEEIGEIKINKRNGSVVVTSFKELREDTDDGMETQVHPNEHIYDPLDIV